MVGSMHARVAIVGCLVAAAIGLFPARAASEPQRQTAQGANTSSAQPQEPQRRADFLFSRPKGSVGLRGGWVFASAGSDLFDFVTRQLTIDKKDFNTPGVGGDVAFALTSRLDAQAGFEWNKMSKRSEYREFVDNQSLPIEQSTSLKTIHVGGSLRYMLTPRGREVSRLAWVPNRVVPYIGAGAGLIYYDFQQTGDFVDFVDLSVFADVFRSKGWAPSAHALGGVNIQIHRGLYGTVEGRYTKASGKLSSDFIDFDPLDLSGFRMSAGINVLF
jgi:hypothetical protein